MLDSKRHPRRPSADGCPGWTFAAATGLRVSSRAPVVRVEACMSLAAQFQIEYLQYLGPDGKPVAELPQAFRDAAALVPLFKQMLYVRTFDAKAIALQRTGKLGTYASCLGHEATHVGIGAS